MRVRTASADGERQQARAPAGKQHSGRPPVTGGFVVHVSGIINAGAQTRTADLLITNEVKRQPAAGTGIRWQDK